MWYIHQSLHIFVSFQILLGFWLLLKDAFSRRLEVTVAETVVDYSLYSLQRAIREYIILAQVGKSALHMWRIQGPVKCSLHASTPDIQERITRLGLWDRVPQWCKRNYSLKQITGHIQRGADRIGFYENFNNWVVFEKSFVGMSLFKKFCHYDLVGCKGL
eukprot:Gregarina_sp_Poly_1__10146@NODE_694_length_6726_cov_13_942184_g524_i0_p4_GENE_NODE_694_length_6726_cov_13_942184_g524_i0NODE_694_length_6726_cov_13_942184_g524_i0_p4_ORF_typecomplete_len160_score5_50_NODE_694_length_6726_cov_13_942184_g524_i080559